LNESSIAIGDRAKAQSSGSIGMGVIAEASGKRSIAMGHHANATGDYSMALGSYNKAIGQIRLQSAIMLRLKQCLRWQLGIKVMRIELTVPMVIQ
jgi:hypothetical protein